MDKNRPKAVVLLSGGLDSATVLALASQTFRCYALTVWYGQRHVVELKAAEQVARAFRAKEHKMVRVDLNAFGGSSLTDDIAVPKDQAGSDQIPNTYVPARNTIMLSLAMAYAETLKCDHIFIGVNAVDYSGYPDCRPEFLETFQRLAELATKRGIEGDRLVIDAPLIHLTKAEIIRKGLGLGVDYSMTHSCYDPSPEGKACRHCDSCLIRQAAFAELGLTDPAWA